MVRKPPAVSVWETMGGFSHTNSGGVLLQALTGFDFADHLGHGTHGAEAAPGSGLEQGIHHQTDDGGSQHDAVEAETELGNPVRDRSCGIGPAPGNPEHPQQFDCLPKRAGTGSNQIGLKNHIAKHAEEEYQKSVAEPPGGEPSGSGFVPGTASAPGQQLTSAAITVAEGLAAADHGNEQGDQKINHAQPRKQDVEKAQGKVNNRPDP